MKIKEGKKNQRHHLKADSLNKTDSWWEGFNKKRDERLLAIQDEKKKEEAAQAFERQIDLMIKLGKIPKSKWPDKRKYHEKGFWKISNDLECFFLIKQHIMLQLCYAAVAAGEYFVPVRHLRFTEDHSLKRKLLEGNPPAPQELAAWEKQLPLQVVIGFIPPSTIENLQKLQQQRKSLGQLNNPTKQALANPTINQITKINATRRA